MYLYIYRSMRCQLRLLSIHWPESIRWENCFCTATKQARTMILPSQSTESIIWCALSPKQNQKCRISRPSPISKTKSIPIRRNGTNIVTSSPNCEFVAVGRTTMKPYPTEAVFIFCTSIGHILLERTWTQINQYLVSVKIKWFYIVRKT